jgi:hypothetical protein
MITAYTIAQAASLSQEILYFFHIPAGCGNVLTLLAMPDDSRDLVLSKTARESIISAITTQSPVPRRPSAVSAAVTLRALLPKISPLSKPERQLLDEWLERIAKRPE